MIRNLGSNFSIAVALALCLLVALPVGAQSSASSAAVSPGPAALTPVYDLSKEVNIQGNILKIDGAGSNAPLIGTHIQIQTAQGVVDTHLGSSASVSARNLGLSVGQSVKVTGMMATVNGNSVLLARILTTPDRVFVLRNEHGMPVRSLLPRGGSSANNIKGGI